LPDEVSALVAEAATAPTAPVEAGADRILHVRFAAGAGRLADALQDEQDRTRHELRRHADPRAVVAAAHVPAAAVIDPVLVAVEEDVAGHRGRVLHARDARDDHQRWRRREVDPDVDVHLGRGRRRHGEHEKRQKSVSHRKNPSFLGSSGD